MRGSRSSAHTTRTHPFMPSSGFKTLSKHPLDAFFLRAQKFRGGKPQITLIGDAAHPTAGLGAMTALRDSGTLTQVLKEEGIQIQSIGKHEDLMRNYAGDAIRQSSIGRRHFSACDPLKKSMQRLSDSIDSFSSLRTLTPLEFLSNFRRKDLPTI